MAEELSLESGLLRLITGHMMMSRSLKHSLYLPQVILWRALHEADQAKVAEHLTRLVPLFKTPILSTPEPGSPANAVLRSHPYRLALLLQQLLEVLSGSSTLAQTSLAALNLSAWPDEAWLLILLSRLPPTGRLSST